MFTSPNTQNSKKQIEVNSFNSDNSLFYIFSIYFHLRNWLIRISSEPFICIYFPQSTYTCAAPFRINIPQPPPSKSLAVNGESGSGS